MGIFLVLMCILSFSKMVVSIDQSIKLEKRLEKLENDFERRFEKLEKEKPYLSICAAKASVKGRYTTITYDSVFHLSTNIGEGGLDKCTGVFTSGLSGTYSVSWNSFSEARGFGDSVVLEKNGWKISETQCSWTQQGRTIMVDLERGNTISLKYNDWNDYGLEKLSFCVSLVHAHDIKQEKVPLVPKMSVLPISKQPENPIYFLKLLIGQEENTTNHELAQSVVDSFKENKAISSRSCHGENTPRKCERECNRNSKQCDPGCKFEFDTLGDCKEMPYGYINDSREKSIINPCFFLKFNPADYWNPNQTKYGGPPNIRRYSRDEQFQIDCQGKIESNEIHSYAELLQIDKTAFPYSILQSINYFVNETELYDELAECGQNITHLRNLIDAQYNIFYYTSINDGEKMMENLKNHSTEFSKSQNDLVKTLLEIYDIDDDQHSYQLGMVTAVLKILDKLPKNEKDNLSKTIEKIVENPDEYGLSKADFQIIHHYFNNLDRYDMGSLLEVIRMIKPIDIDKQKYDGQYVLSKMKEHLSESERVHQRPNPDIYEILNDKFLVDKVMEFGYDLRKFEAVTNYLSDNINNIKISFYPETQGIPRKYFPLNGDEETPYLGIKLHLGDKLGITAGQEILVKCRAWYEGAVHGTDQMRFDKRPRVPKQRNKEQGSAMVKFKIVLE